MKAQCPQCGQHVEADDEWAGSEVTCPICQQAFVLPQLKPRPFTIIELVQGTREWLEWRHKGLGASDASTIMGENRFKSAAQLLQEKRGPAQDFGQNAAMARGTELEPRKLADDTSRKRAGMCVPFACKAPVTIGYAQVLMASPSTTMQLSKSNAAIPSIVKLRGLVLSPIIITVSYSTSW